MNANRFFPAPFCFYRFVLFFRGIYHIYPNGDGTWGSGTILNDDVPNIVSFGEDNEVRASPYSRLLFSLSLEITPSTFTPLI